MDEGVRNSAEMVAHSGTRFGGLGDLTEEERTSRTVCRLGWTPILGAMNAD